MNKLPLNSVILFFLCLSLCAAGATFNIVDFGARVTDCLVTTNIQAAIDACHLAGGGEVVVPEGVFRTGGLELKSGVTLRLMDGATLEGSADCADYAYKGETKPWYRGLLRADGAHGIAVVGGRYSVIDGRNCFDPNGEECYRGPHAIRFTGCTNVVLKGYSVRDSANWAHALFRCANVKVDNVRVYGGHDGFDAHVSSNVVLSACEFHVGDDAIAGFGNECMIVRDTILDSSCSAARFGGRNCLFERCRTVFPGSFGHRWKLSAEDKRRAVNHGEVLRHGGGVFNYYCDFRWGEVPRPENIVFRDCTFDHPASFFYFRYDGRSQWCCNRPLASIAFENCEILGVQTFGRFYGGEEDPLSITLKNCRVTSAPGASAQPVLSGYNFKKIRFENVSFEGFADPCVEKRSEGEVEIVGGTPVRVTFRKDPNDEVYTFEKAASLLAGMTADMAAFDDWMAGNAARGEVWRRAYDTWRGKADAREEGEFFRRYYGYCFKGGKGVVASKLAEGEMSDVPFGAFVYALAQRTPLVARVAVTDFIRTSPHAPAAVAGAKEALRRILSGAGQSAWNKAMSGDGDASNSVDTLIGGSYRGHTFPGATCPFSLVQASPDTGLCDWDHCSGYVWEDKYVYGFSQTHLSGTGCPDLADVRLLPFSAGFADGDPVKWRQAKDFGSEKGKPGYYTVAFTNDGIVAEATATPRVGVYRFTYAAGKPVKLLVDLQWVNAGGIRKAVVEFENALGGDGCSFSGGRRTHAWLRRSVYWKVVFDRPWTKATKLPKAQPTEKGDRYVLEFAPGAPLVVKAAISTVDKDGAAKNYTAEAEGRSFDAIRAEARAKWNALLSRMQVPGASAEQRTAFYTALYHLFIQPNDIADVDGRYRGGDAKVATAKDGAYYTGLSLWDTFRAAHPFYTLAVPERVDGFVNSMLGHYRALGFLPVIPYFGWESYCMIGNHSVPVIVDAYLKGFRGFDADLAFEAVTNSLTVAHRDIYGSPKIKEEWELYDRCGYYPCDKIRGESVSRTLECGFDDWCAAQFCAALGRGDEARFRRRAVFWRNLFDPDTRLMRGRMESGSWRTPFDPFSTGHDHNKANDYTEGNAWQYTWHVLQDPQGLVAAMGGPEPFVQRLDSVFSQPEELHDRPPPDVTGLIGQYAHGNEPSHHIAYFYPFAGRPDRTAEVVREVCDRFYGVKPGDLCGNDDCGQMSAWYVFAAMGFYPFNPCGGDYVLGAPQFPKVMLALPGGKTFTVVAKNLSRENKYVKSVTLNGRPLGGFILKHADIVRGGELVFEMCASRN
jgi:predicted alpha-1,2-mannosidase